MTIEGGGVILDGQGTTRFFALGPRAEWGIFDSGALPFSLSLKIRKLLILIYKLVNIFHVIAIDSSLAVSTTPVFDLNDDILETF